MKQKDLFTLLAVVAVVGVGLFYWFDWRSPYGFDQNSSLLKKFSALASIPAFGGIFKYDRIDHVGEVIVNPPLPNDGNPLNIPIFTGSGG